MNDYYLFLDESGNHGLTELNPNFPVFLLCGIVISADCYKTLDNDFIGIKQAFWKNQGVIFHSRDIRKCQKEFQILFDLAVKEKFYSALNRVVTKCDYAIIASGIQKETYVKRFGRLSNDVYELCLSFIIERAIFYLDDIKVPDKRLSIVLEKRTKEQDQLIKEHFQRLMARGTGYVVADRLKSYHLNINFRSKRQNVNGLQLADLVAYPTACYVIDPDRPNLAFDVFKGKFYMKGNAVYGLKIYP